LDVNERGCPFGKRGGSKKVTGRKSRVWRKKQVIIAIAPDTFQENIDVVAPSDLFTYPSKKIKQKTQEESDQLRGRSEVVPGVKHGNPTKIQYK